MQAYFQPFLATPDDVRELSCRIQHQLTMLVPQRRRQGPSSLSGVTVWATSAKELKLMLDWTLLDSGARRVDQSLGDPLQHCLHARR